MSRQPDIKPQQACPVCDIAHDLVPETHGDVTLYRCEKTGRKWMASDLVETREVAGVKLSDEVVERAKRMADSTQMFVGAKPRGYSQLATANPDDTVRARGSVLRFLRTRHGLELDEGLSESGGVGTQTDFADTKYSPPQEIARGGMGSVSVVKDLDLNRDVAMKTLLSEHAQSPEYVSRFVSEAQLISQLEHPNITPLYDLGVHDSGEVFFTMKFVKGETLADIIKRLQDGDTATHERYTWNRRLQILEQICEALGYAHCRGVLHRDLKPANIMIGRYGEVQVMDWGIAKKLDGPTGNAACDEAASRIERTQIEVNQMAPHQTGVGVVTGTAYYMSPEQAAGDSAALGPTSDIYSLGAVMYEFLGLERAHPGNDMATVLRRVLTEDAAPLSELKSPHQPRVPRELQYIAQRAMKKEPSERYQTVMELREDLQRFQDGKFPVTCPHTALKRSLVVANTLLDNHSRGVLVALVLGLLALLLLIALLAIY